MINAWLEWHNLNSDKNEYNNNEVNTELGTFVLMFIWLLAVLVHISEPEPVHIIENIKNIMAIKVLNVDKVFFKMSDGLCISLDIVS